MNTSSVSIIKDLNRLTSGLMFQSESDYPVEPFTMPGNGSDVVSGKDVVAAAKLEQGSEIKELDLYEFFGNAMEEQEWHDDEQRTVVNRFRKLVQFLDSRLENIRVYRIGDVEAVVCVVGKTDSGDFAGVTVNVVET